MPEYSQRMTAVKTVPIKAGGFMAHPAGAVHFDGAKDEAVTVEIRGMEPVTTTSVDKASTLVRAASPRLGLKKSLMCR